MNLIKMLATAALVLLQFSAHASLIDPLEYSDGTRTWLKLSETAGLSMNDFRGGAGGWNSTYRLASSQEIELLLTSFGITEGDSGHHPTVPGAANFVHNFGGRTESGANGTYFNGGDQGAIGRGIGWYVSVALTSGDNSYFPPRGPECPTGFGCARTIALNEAQSPNERSFNTGLFLIRQDSPHGVPEPTSLALLGMGLAGVYHRLKKRSK